MPDKRRIIMMTKLALYDKRYGREDARKESYFRHDWIYRRNSRNRFCALAGCGIVIILYEAHRILSGAIDVMTMDYRAEIVKLALAVIAAAVAYTLVGTVLYTREYTAAHRRLAWYFATLDKLDERGEELKRRRQAEKEIYRTRRLSNDGYYEDAEELYGTDEDDSGSGAPLR